MGLACCNTLGHAPVHELPDENAPQLLLGEW